MKTGKVRDPGGGAEPYLEIDGWTPWQYYVPEAELEKYYNDTNALMMKLERMPPAIRARHKQIEIRCPVKGCLLATIYWMSFRPTAEQFAHYRRDVALRAASGRLSEYRFPQRGHYLYVGRTAGGTEVYDILNYLFFDSPPTKFPSDCLSTRSCIAYWLAGCRHGTAPIDHAAIDDMLSIAARIFQPAKTEEEAVARLPEHLKPFWGKRVFHPEPAAWRPKKRQPRSVRFSLRS
jgi:hypothetical protein